MPRKKSEAEAPVELPIKLDSTTNGEYAPKPLPAVAARARALAESVVAQRARALGMSRREFLQSSAGAATVLLALNQASGCAGGHYRMPKEAGTDPAAADSALRGEEFIFDVQTHHVETERAWWETKQPNMMSFLSKTPQARCGAREVDCFDRDHFFKEVFLDSDTSMSVLSALWGTPQMNPIHADEAARTRERMAQMEGAPRLLIHGVVYGKATTPAQNREQMQAMKEDLGVAAWKLYPVWSDDGLGYRLDGEATGMRVIETGLATGVPIFAVHKGLRLPGMKEAAIDALDVGPAAKAFPKATFLIYHSGYDSDHSEGPYDPKSPRGVDTLIRSVQDAGIGKQGNVYAELGSVWREVMKDPQQAAHVLGKLLAHLGEDRILWGTDAIWYGSPQDQIQAFRTFEIGAELQERYGYPPLTKEAKAKIFGLNAARVYGVDVDEIRKAQAWDKVARAREAYRDAPSPTHRTYGPRTRRELLSLLRHSAVLGG